MSTFVPPQSKSDAQRALVLARITGVADPQLDEALPSDVAALKAGLDGLELGATDLECGDGGAPFRFLLAQAAVRSRVPVRLWGTRRLAQRPHTPLAAALPGVTLLPPGEGERVLIAEVQPLAQLPAGFTVSSDQSSQFASSLLLAAAAICERRDSPCGVRVEGARVSDGYLQMTLRWLRAAGFEVSGDGDFSVKRGAAKGLPPIPGDWSSLGYLLLIAWAARGTVARMSEPALHPDGAIVRALALVGLTVHGDGSVTGALRGQLEVSALTCPDSIPTLAAVACVLQGPSRFSDCGILRGKESDRVEGICALVRASGGSTRVEGETLTVLPGTRVRALRFDSHGDHRMAMSAASLAALAKVPLALRGMDCVAKSFPGFWAELAKANVAVERLS